MTYDEAIALFGFKELPPPNTIRCEEIEQFNTKLWSKYNELNAATSDRTASATINREPFGNAHSCCLRC